MKGFPSLFFIYCVCLQPLHAITYFSDAFPALEFQQTSSGGPVATGGYRFVLYDSFPSSRVSFVLPNGIPVDSAVNQSFPTLDALHATYPAGQYTSVYTPPFPSGTPVSVQANVLSNPSFDVPTPTILNSSWQNGKLTLAPGEGIHIAPWENRTETTLLRLELKSGPQTISVYYPTSAREDLSGSFDFLEANIRPNTEYQGTLWFTDFSEITSAPVGMFEDLVLQTGAGRSTSFVLMAIPEPAEWAAISGAAMLAFGVFRHYRRRHLEGAR